MSTRVRSGRAQARFGAIGLAAAIVLIGAGTAAVGAALQEEPFFPHERHARLFPVCVGCHSGVPESDPAAFYPEPGSCARCHDGEQQQPVAWEPPAPRVNNLRFEHTAHARILAEEGDPEQRCETCHSRPGAGRMAVQGEVQLATCWSCHAHRATDHQVDAECASCHTPLAESGLGSAQIAAFDVPVDHQAPGFLEGTHGSAAGSNLGRCATCHTQDRCVACHVDTDRPEIAALAPAPAGMELPPAAARYPTPASHQAESWFSGHGASASTQACATCHTQDDCRTCHVSPLPTAVAALPPRSRVVAPGVRLIAQAPSSHASLFFLDVHRTLAAAEGGTCSTCHEDSFCVSCHEGPSLGGYHPPGFVAQHSAEAFGRQAECATCHNTQAFCRECHAQSGLTGSGRLGAGYHSAGAFWLIRHGQAARQGLESCISCHKQTDCTQCHGVAGAFKVSPHSSDFDAERAWERSPRTCIACHLRNPLGGGEP